MKKISSFLILLSLGLNACTDTESSQEVEVSWDSAIEAVPEPIEVLDINQLNRTELNAEIKLREAKIIELRSSGASRKDIHMVNKEILLLMKAVLDAAEAETAAERAETAAERDQTAADLERGKRIDAMTTKLEQE